MDGHTTTWSTVLDALRELVENGVVTLEVADTSPTFRATEAHQRLQQAAFVEGLC